MEFKREAIEYAEKDSNHKAEEKFWVAAKRIREYRQNKLKIFEKNIMRVSRKLIMAKAKCFYESKCDESEKSVFVVKQQTSKILNR